MSMSTSVLLACSSHISCLKQSRSQGYLPRSVKPKPSKTTYVVSTQLLVNNQDYYVHLRRRSNEMRQKGISHRTPRQNKGRKLEGLTCEMNDRISIVKLACPLHRWPTTLQSSPFSNLITANTNHCNAGSDETLKEYDRISCSTTKASC
jgi:hypothetical protein